MIMDYQLIRSNRKTLSLQINHDAELIVRAPNQLPVKKIEQFIDEKSSWIEKKSNTIRLTKSQKPTYKNGEKFLYLGNSYPLSVNTSHQQGLNFNGEVFKLNTGGKCEFLKYYKSAFKKIALPRVNYYADTYQFSYNQVRLKAQKTLWGSCSCVNNINLNYLLIGAPISVIDYVIVHELSHTIYKNHSKDFWQLVASILPDYKIDKKWLKDNGHKLHNL